MPDHGISRLKNAPWEPTSKPSTAGDTTDLKTQSLHRWTTVCRACWDSGWSSPRTSTTPTNSGWSGRCFPSPFAGRSCCITSESNTFTCPQPHLSKDSRCYRLRKERLFWTWVFLSTAGKKIMVFPKRPSLFVSTQTPVSRQLPSFWRSSLSCDFSETIQHQWTCTEAAEQVPVSH